MNICIPINKNEELESQICLHFASAPLFIVVNTETLEAEVVENHESENDSDASRCQKVAKEKGVEAVVVGGIGLEALSDLQSSGLAVYSSTKDTVREIVEEFVSGAINPITLGSGCKQGGRGFGGRGFGGMGCGGGGCGC